MMQKPEKWLEPWTTQVKVDGPVRPRNGPVFSIPQYNDISQLENLQRSHYFYYLYGPVITGSEPVTGPFGLVNLCHIWVLIWEYSARPIQWIPAWRFFKNLKFKACYLYGIIWRRDVSFKLSKTFLLQIYSEICFNENILTKIVMHVSKLFEERDVIFKLSYFFYWNILQNTKKQKKWLKPWHMGTHLKVLSDSYPMNTNMAGFRWFPKIFASLCFGRK